MDMKHLFVVILCTFMMICGCSSPVIGPPPADTPQVTREILTSQVPSTPATIEPEPSTPVPTFTPLLELSNEPGATIVSYGDTNGLIAAINAANDRANDPGPDTIILEGGLFSLDEIYEGVDADGPSGLPSIRSNIIIIGNGAIIERSSDSHDEFRVFHVSERGTLELRELTIRNGSAPGFPGGGGIFNKGSVILQGCTIIDNSNTALYNSDGSITLENSTIHRNQGILGGGIFNRNPHLGQGQGVSIINSTISENLAGSGGGIYNFVGSVTLVNTIVAMNQDLYHGGDCAGNPILSNGHNLDSDGSCALGAQGDIPNTDPMLGPLTNDGGRTGTLSLQPQSPAIDAGDDTACSKTDQRGVLRPSGSHCDIGAYEFKTTDG